MAIKVILQIPEKDIDAYSKVIAGLINDDPQLTNRSVQHLKNMMVSGHSRIAISGKEICGFVFRYPITEHIFELQSLWVHPLWRKKGLGRKLLTEITDKTTVMYLAAVISPYVEPVIRELSFYPPSFKNTPISVIFKYGLYKIRGGSRFGMVGKTRVYFRHYA